MFRLNIFFFICVLLCSSILSAQTFDEREQSKLQFTNYLDSLNSKDRFDLIIDTCTKELPNYLSAIQQFNLIGAYYYLGDTFKARELMNEALVQQGIEARSALNILSIDYAVYKRYLLENKMKDVILDYMNDKFKCEDHSEELLGLELMHLYVHDQWLRYSSDVYNKLKTGRTYLHRTGMDSTVFMYLQELHTDTVFSFYRKTERLFSQKEIGTLAFVQSALLFHEWNLERRDYYHTLVKNAVMNGDFSEELLMNFEAGTQYIILGIEEYFKRREEIQNELRIRYNKPDYHIRLL